MTITQKEGTTIIQLEGRLDTTNAPELAQAIPTMAFEKLVIMLDKLEYISSAGLRALMICQKTAQERKATLEVMHPTPAVLDVMTMSGFNKVLTIIEA